MTNEKQGYSCLSASIFAILFTEGCQKAYYSTMEKFGVHKRDIMVDRVAEARDSQQEAKEQFKSFLDQVLYLKHNLNAQAIASLQSELGTVESDIADLIKEMEKSIGEANSFIRTMLEE
ncbi:MAG: DUF2959 family protein [Desulfobulbales bacterium]